MDIWVDEKNTTAWDYIGVIEATLTSSRVDIYRYEDRFIENSALPIIHGDPSWTAPGPGGLRSQDDVAQVLEPLIEFVNKTVPAQQLARTPLYVYGSGTFRHMDAKTKHELLQSSCKYVQDHSANLVSDCSTHISAVEGYQQAVLDWLAANHEWYSQQASNATRGILDITPSGVHLAYRLDSDSTTTDLVRLGLRAANESAIYTDLHAEFHDLIDFLDDKKIAKCIRNGTQLFGIEGSGNFGECKAAVGGFAQSIATSLSNVNEDIVFSGIKGFDAYAQAKGNESALEELCNGQGEQGAAGQAADCLSAVIAQQLVSTLPAVPNVTVEHGPDASVRAEWTLGRALLYADVDLSQSGGQSIGVHENVGSKRWVFGQSDTVARPELGGNGKKDWVDHLDSRSHRLLGGVILLVALSAVIYLILGKAGRSRIWAAITRSPKPPGWTKVASTEENYELDDVALGEEADEDFEV